MALHALVIGGGPVGSLAALLLSKDFRVTLTDARSATDVAASKTARSFNYVLNGRGQSALDAAGALPIPGITVRGNLRHTGDKASFRKDLRGAIAISRGALVSHLHAMAGRVPSITPRLGKPGELVSINATTKTAAFADGASLAFDLLVVADGVHSASRKQLLEQGALASVSQLPDVLSYKLLPLPPPTAETRPMFRTWAAKQQGTASILAPPACEGQDLMGIMILPRTSDVPSDWTWDKLGDDAGLHAACLDACFPGACGDEQGTAAAAAFMAPCRPQTGGFTTVCSSLVAPPSSHCIALLGDAGHSCLASLGQGCNAGLEGAARLAAALSASLSSPSNPSSSSASASSPSDTPAARVSAGLAAFNSAHKPNADAIGRLSLSGFGAGSRVRTASFFARLALVALLSKLTFGLVPPPSLMKLWEADVPYSAIEAQSKREALLLRTTTAVCVVLALAAAASHPAAGAAAPRAAAGVAAACGAAWACAVAWAAGGPLRRVVAAGAAKSGGEVAAA